MQMTVVRHACTERQNPAWHTAYLAMGQGIGQHYKVARALAHDRDRKASARSRNRGTCCSGRLLLPFLGHQPVKERELQIRGWVPGPQQGEKHPAGGLVAMFRRPAQRLISAFLDKRHTGGTNAADRRSMPRNLTGFARHPGVAGCMTKMLTGRECGAPVHVGDAAVARAVALVRSPAFRFVGLVEEWDRSICLFHRMMGTAPMAAEFRALGHSANSHSGQRACRGRRGECIAVQANNMYDETALGGFADPADDAVYAAAVEVFQRNLREHST